MKLGIVADARKVKLSAELDSNGDAVEIELTKAQLAALIPLLRTAVNVDHFVIHYEVQGPR